ncbi:hypothetical protein FQN57_002036 [Myotisia sp. PD_48]|nr:hypothetical protein FQN57_002036 [Myotisia sp. PD_48]
MALRYQVDELLRLRESPLVTKPDGLPPIEEWMGPIPDPSTQKKQNSSRDQPNQTETTSTRRPSLLDNRHHISRLSNSEDIVLGPPKTLFSSATRGFGKVTDAPDKYPSKSQDQDDKYGYREKFFKDKELGDKDRDFDRRDARDGRVNLVNGRRNGRDEKEDWSGARPRRTFGQEGDSDRRIKRGDGDRWDSRDFKDYRDQHEPANERGIRDKEHGRFPTRRDTQTRGRHDNPSWFRDGEDQVEPEEEKTPIRHREWRRGGQGQDREWPKPTRQEQDPEWMDSSAKGESKEAHTQEDFQRWKERMKSGGTAPAQEEPPQKIPAADAPSIEAKQVETTRADEELFSRVESSYKPDIGLDNLFGLWGESKATGQEARPELTAAPPSSKDTQSMKPAKSSRFAGFFNAPAETLVKEHDHVPVAPRRPVSTDADQEGFQRILQLLGGNKSGNASPQVEELAHPKLTPPQPSQIDYGRPPAPTASPLRENYNRQEFSTFPEIPREQQAILNAQQYQASRTSKDRNTEFLLRLMQQAKIDGQQGQPQTQQMPMQSPSGIHPMDMQGRGQEMPKHKSQMYYDDPSIAMQVPDTMDPRNQLRRRATAGPTGYFDEGHYQGTPAGNQTPNNPPGLRTQPTAPPSLGLQRPPGLEQLPSPGWANPQMQQGGANQYMGRPGQPPPNRSMNPNMLQNYPPIPPMHMPGGIPPPNDRQAFQQRGVGAGGPANYGLPPGIVPPPGYMNHPPPSSLPPMTHNLDGMVGPHGHPGHLAGGPQRGNITYGASSKELFDLISGRHPNQDPNMGGRNVAGMMGPGPYR